MNQWLGNEGFLQRVFVKIWDLLILNLCFLAACVPIFTIGAARSALFAVNLKAVRKEEGAVFGEFWKAFKINFRQATKLWGVLVLLGAVFAVDFWALKSLGGTAAWMLNVLLAVLLLAYLGVQPWIFGYQARFADDTKTVLKNALILCGANLPVSALLLAISLGTGVLSFWSVNVFFRALFLWIVLGFALVNYVQSWLLRRVFDRLKSAA